MKRFFTAAVSLALAFAGREAAAQNVDPFFHGDEAALSAGAVTASGRDSGSFWYNPAGFGGLKRGLVSASASTFGVRVRPVPAALKVRLGPTIDTDDLDSLDIISVPNAVVAATNLTGGIAIAGGLLTTSRDLRTAFLDAPTRTRTNLAGARLDVDQRLDLQRDNAWYHFGVAVAAELSPRLRIGGALYGGYAKYTFASTYLLDARTPDGQTVVGVSGLRVTNSGFTATGTFGAQYELSKRVTMGATLRAPEFVLSTSSEGGLSSGTTSSSGLTRFERVGADLGENEGRMVNPGRLLLGTAFALGPPQSWLELGVDVAHGLPGSLLFSRKRPVMNARVGVRYMLSPSWIVGGGLFTDRSNYREPAGDFAVNDRIDWYGFTAGVSKRTPLALTQNPSPDAIVLVTTLSLRAAVGAGQVGIYDVELDDRAPPTTRPWNDVLFWEVMPYLGSAVIF